MKLLNKKRNKILFFSFFLLFLNLAPLVNAIPQYSQNSTNSTLAGSAVEHRLKWVDDVGLSGFIFSFNNGTTTRTEVIKVSLTTDLIGDYYYGTTSSMDPTTEFTNTDYSLTNVSDNNRKETIGKLGGVSYATHKFQYYLGNLTGFSRQNVTYIRYCYEGHYSGAVSPQGNLKVFNFTSGSWSNVASLNLGTDTTICKEITSNFNDYISPDNIFKFGAQAVDSDIELGQAQAVLRTDYVNLTVIYQVDLINYTWVAFTAEMCPSPYTECWSNVTVVINSTVGATIKWCVYANDTSNNWNGTSCLDPFSYTTTPFSITIISPENKTYNTSFFWANISLNKPGSMALYSLDNQPNQTLTKFNDTYFYKKVYSTSGSHKIIFYANDTEGIMVNSTEIYFYLNVTGYITIELSTKKAWWNDSILVYGEAKDWEGKGIEDSLVKVMVGEKEYENYTDSNGIWSCKINTPNEIGNHLLSIEIGGIKNFTYLKVSPFYGKEEKNVEKKVYESPVLIQDKNGKIKIAKLRVYTY
ncbi:MAG: hypothetical protein QW472_05170 [Candidatus Aenigmatarchaeota archaeon]